MNEANRCLTAIELMIEHFPEKENEFILFRKDQKGISNKNSFPEYDISNFENKEEYYKFLRHEIVNNHDYSRFRSNDPNNPVIRLKNMSDEELQRLYDNCRCDPWD